MNIESYKNALLSQVIRTSYGQITRFWDLMPYHSLKTSKLSRHVKAYN